MYKKRRKKNKIHLPKFIDRYLYSLVLLLIGLIAWLIVHEIHEPAIPAADGSVEIYSTQAHDDLKNNFMGAIRRAEKSITLIIFAMTERGVIETLKEKAASGVNVNVICDAKNSWQLKEKLGAQVNTYLRLSDGLMHLKILVVDDKEVWLGSANMTGESLRMHDNLVISVIHPQLAQFIENNALLLMKSENVQLQGYGRFLCNGQELELSFLPYDRYAIDRIKHLIAAAKKTLQIAMFTWTRPDLAHAVIAAEIRGVQTAIFVDRNSANGAGKNIVKQLSAAGIDLMQNVGPTLLHHKMMIIDDNILVNGSANWTKAAFTQNDDCFIILHDLTEKQKNKLHTVWQTMLNEGTTLQQTYQQPKAA